MDTELAKTVRYYVRATLEHRCDGRFALLFSPAVQLERKQSARKVYLIAKHMLFRDVDFLARSMSAYLVARQILKEVPHETVRGESGGGAGGGGDLRGDGDGCGCGPEADGEWGGGEEPRPLRRRGRPRRQPREARERRYPRLNHTRRKTERLTTEEQKRRETPDEVILPGLWTYVVIECCPFCDGSLVHHVCTDCGVGIPYDLRYKYECRVENRGGSILFTRAHPRWPGGAEFCQEGTGSYSEHLRYKLDHLEV